MSYEGKGKIGGKCLSFCLYTGSNDRTYMNHIIYDVAYGCGKWLNKVTMSGQQMANHFKHCNGLKEKSAGPEKVSNNVTGPSSDMTAGRSRDKPKKKKEKKMKFHEKSLEVLPPTGSVVSPHCNVCTASEKPPAGAEETNPKMRSPVKSRKHPSKHGKDGREKLTKKSEDMPKKDVLMKGTPQKGKTHSRDKTDSDKPHKKKKT